MNSLLCQSFTNWICELHNDDPKDTNPEVLVREIGDPRLHIVNHDDNLGAVRSFNFCWAPIAEPYMSILEDDNWWEPQFLEDMITFMDANPEVRLAWANMRMWRERPDGQWDRERTIWPTKREQWTIWHQSPPRQLLEPLHSQGAMLVRAGSGIMVAHPPSTPLFIIEAVRERRIGLPIALNRKVCANFALTLSTARREDLVQKVGGQIVLARDYMGRINASPELIHAAWMEHWWTGRYALRSIVLACMIEGHFGLLDRLLVTTEFWRCIAWFALHPVVTVKSVQFALQNVELRAFLSGDQAILR